jgi:hypothetical protein
VERDFFLSRELLAGVKKLVECGQVQNLTFRRVRPSANTTSTITLAPGEWIVGQIAKSRFKRHCHTRASLGIIPTSD